MALASNAAICAASLLALKPGASANHGVRDRGAVRHRPAVQAGGNSKARHSPAVEPRRGTAEGRNVPRQKEGRKEHGACVIWHRGTLVDHRIDYIVREVNQASGVMTHCHVYLSAIATPRALLVRELVTHETHSNSGQWASNIVRARAMTSLCEIPQEQYGDTARKMEVDKDGKGKSESHIPFLRTCKPKSCNNQFRIALGLTSLCKCSLVRKS